MQEECAEEERRQTRIQQRLAATTRQAVMHRVQFLKVYGNKKAKYEEQQMEEQRRSEVQQVQVRSQERTRRRRLQLELQQALALNEQEEQVGRLQSQRRQRREVRQAVCRRRRGNWRRRR